MLVYVFASYSFADLFSSEAQKTRISKDEKLQEVEFFKLNHHSIDD